LRNTFLDDPLSRMATSKNTITTRCCEIEDVEAMKRIAPPLQPTQLDAQGYLGVRFVAYDILFNVIEAIFEFHFHSGDI